MEYMTWVIINRCSDLSSFKGNSKLFNFNFSFIQRHRKKANCLTVVNSDPIYIPTNTIFNSVT